MKRDELIKEVKKYFQLKELVCPHCVNTFGDNAWQFISTELLSIIYTLRTQIIKKPMIINSYDNNLTQRGLRCNICQLCKDKTNSNKIYISAHALGKAIDFTVNDMSAEEVRNLIRSNIDKFEYPIRLERFVDWIHIDCYTVDGVTKLVEFNG